MMRFRALATLFLLLFCALAVLPSDSFAATQFFKEDEVCSQSGVEHILSMVMCSFVQIMNSVLVSVYNGMQQLLEDIVGAALTFYIAVFGAQMILAVGEITARDFLTRIVKIALIWTFVSNGSWGVEYAFKFFVELAGEGVGWVLSAVPPPSDDSGCFDPGSSTGGFAGGLARLDVVLCQAVKGPLTSVDSKVVGFFLVLLFVAPQIGMLAVSWLWYNLRLLIDGAVTFLLGIAAIALLVAMSPIFLSFMLFKHTAGFFENWLKYMISFSLQIIIVFGCIALWITVTSDFMGFFDDLAKTIFPDNRLTTKQQAQNPGSSWGVCPFKYTPDGGGGENSPPGPYVECASENTPKEKVIPITGLLWNDKSQELGCDSGNGKDDCTKFIEYMVYHLITLIIIAFTFEALMREAPRIAVYLAGPDYTPPLAGGFGPSRTGAVRSLFAPSSAGAYTPGDQSSFSLRDVVTGLFSGSGTPPPAPETDSAESSTPAQEYKKRMPSLFGKKGVKTEN